jgi:hypothetical protein
MGLRSNRAGWLVVGCVVMTLLESCRQSECVSGQARCAGGARRQECLGGHDVAQWEEIAPCPSGEICVSVQPFFPECMSAEIVRMCAEAPGFNPWPGVGDEPVTVPGTLPTTAAGFGPSVGLSCVSEELFGVAMPPSSRASMTVSGLSAAPAGSTVAAFTLDCANFHQLDAVEMSADPALGDLVVSASASSEMARVIALLVCARPVPTAPIPFSVTATLSR